MWWIDFDFDNSQDCIRTVLGTVLKVPDFIRYILHRLQGLRRGRVHNSKDCIYNYRNYLLCAALIDKYFLKSYVFRRRVPEKLKKCTIEFILILCNSTYCQTRNKTNCFLRNMLLSLWEPIIAVFATMSNEGVNICLIYVFSNYLRFNFHISF